MNIAVYIREWWPIVLVVGGFLAWALVKWLSGFFVSEKGHKIELKNLVEGITRDIDNVRSSCDTVKSLVLGLQDRMADQEARIKSTERDVVELRSYGSEPLRELEREVKNQLLDVEKTLHDVKLRLEFLIKQGRRRDRA